MLTGTLNRYYLNVARKDQEEFIPHKKPQLVIFTVHLEPVYALLDSNAIPDIIFERLAKKLKL